MRGKGGSLLADRERDARGANTRGLIDTVLRSRALADKDIPRDGVTPRVLRVYTFPFHVFYPIPGSLRGIPLFSCASRIRADPCPRHHGITLTCQSRLPLRHFPPLLLRDGWNCPFFIDLVYLRSPVSSSRTSVLRDLSAPFPPLTHFLSFYLSISILVSVLLLSSVSSF